MAASVKPNLIDKVYGYFAPKQARERLYHRQMMALAGGYSGASRSSNAMRGWATGNQDADSILEWDLPTLRDRSSDLVRNNPLAAGAINTNVTSIIGTGLKVKPTISREFLGISEEEADTWERKARFIFNTHAKKIDFQGKLTFAELQSLAFRSSLEKGDSFALLTNRENPQTPLKVAVQLIEADRICNKDSQADSSSKVQGVHKDSSGRATAFDVMTVHPGNSRQVKRDWRTIPASLPDGRPVMLHIVKQLRIGQTRGIPYLAPVIEALKQLGRYTEGELMAAVIGGMFTVFVKSESGDVMEMGSTGTASVAASSNELEMGHGAIVDLNEGEDIEVANPGRPNVAFDPFVLAILRQVGVALELPFELLVKHFTASYTAAQAALLEAWRYFSGRRRWFSDSFCQPIYEAVIDEAVAMGMLDAPGYFTDPMIRQAYLGSVWIGDARGQIDDKKASEGQKNWLDMGVKTLEKVTMEVTGDDWEVNHTQSVKEYNARKEAGLIQETNPVQQVEIDTSTDD